MNKNEPLYWETKYPSKRQARAAYKSYWGLVKDNNHIHHIVPWSEGGTNWIGNLVALSPDEHSEIHRQRGDVYVQHLCKYMNTAIASKAGKKSSQVARNGEYERTDYHRDVLLNNSLELARTGVSSKNGKRLKDEGRGIFGRTPEQAKRDRAKATTTLLDRGEHISQKRYHCPTCGRDGGGARFLGKHRHTDGSWCEQNLGKPILLITGRV